MKSLKSTFTRTLLATLTIGALGVSGATHATEGGGTSYALGLENFMVGALPPPGLYGLVYGYFYSANQLEDNSGHKEPVNFHADVDVIAPRLIWVPGVQILGGELAFHTVLPLMDMSVTAGPAKQSSFAQGDATIGGGLGYNYTEHFHAIYATDFILPTGAYNKDNLVNQGRNYLMIQPVVCLEYIDPQGFNAGVKIMYDFNTKNSATDYTSGQELIVDYGAGWGLGHGWTAGVGGYIYRQTTNDEQYGQTIYNNKGRAFAIGPSVEYNSGRGWLVTAKFAPEMDVRNRPEGSVFTIKAVMPL